jgi:enamine deaminase RidA (YjgF/YER057c/UK114 family)
VWRNVIAQLHAAGMSVENIVKVTVFLSSRDYAMANREIRQEVLGSHAPALTVIMAGISTRSGCWRLRRRRQPKHRPGRSIAPS